ncbi:hypothetical protein [Rhodococcus sp. HS-D2]|uniref:hypothetical protein n=1 Tax=Rhodococcus sp. HS-D2 TaxID=1384636 RepID=UPI0007D9C06F|nr:hypothetical protein [Rhodococcus sp. HS-D2]
MRDMIVRDLTAGVDPVVFDDLLLYRYQKEFGLTYLQVLNEPMEAIERAALIWSLENDRDMLKEKRRQAK